VGEFERILEAKINTLTVSYAIPELLNVLQAERYLSVSPRARTEVPERRSTFQNIAGTWFRCVPDQFNPWTTGLNAMDNARNMPASAAVSSKKQMSTTGF
jgi:hypothetical protein